MFITHKPRLSHHSIVDGGHNKSRQANFVISTNLLDNLPRNSSKPLKNCKRKVRIVNYPIYTFTKAMTMFAN